jgi:hypothetical protein
VQAGRQLSWLRREGYERLSAILRKIEA